MAKDYSKKMKESALIQQTEEYMDNEVFGNQQEQGRAEATVPVGSPSVNQAAQLIPEVNQQMQTVAQPATPAPQQTVAHPAVVQSDPVPYSEVLKNVGAKIPYSIYDRLERIKRQSERTGNKAEKRNIGDLIAQAIKEFVEKYDIPTPTLP